ncbi:hypothetical protein E4633_16435 [Geomonas terrae]|uniref:Uncharacterized protein n=1 Tax=Geomonas terrae TaxID=2562681 RepID=A0A4S1CC68_9BACT|nr:hypothetical protein [Geomonas terrae]TGU70590.1 hypothetical protein E4633_16435 [Geomonas terrae]
MMGNLFSLTNNNASFADVRRIFVSFRDEHGALFLPLLQAGDTVFGEVCGSVPEGVQHVTAHCSGFDGGEVLEEVRAFFGRLETEFGILFRGFANNFTECSVVPVGRFIVGLSAAIDDLQRCGATVEVFFPERYRLAKRTSSYYLAEHESQGVLFYRREAYFSPYLQEVCRRRGVTVRFLRNDRLSVLWLTDLARTWFVLAARIAAALTMSMRPEKPGLAEADRAGAGFDLLALTRTPSQTETITPFLKNSGFSVAVGLGESFLARGKNWSMAQRLNDDKFRVYPLASTGRRSMAWRYLRRGLQLLRKRSLPRLEVAGIALNMNQAVREMLVMLPDLEIYQQNVESWLRSMGRPELPLLLSLEQKSPHAFADAHTAQKLGLHCFHIMQCDQHAVPLPYPVFGDFFLVDSRSNLDRFRKVWPECSDQVRYVGTFKAVVPKPDPALLAAAGEEPVWCFFTSDVEVEENLQIIRILSHLRESRQLRFVVKLHPRDNLYRYRLFPDLTFISDGELARDALFSRFSHAITFPSGVVLDLIFREKPFLLIDVGKFSAKRDDVYMDRRYRGVISDLNDMVPLLNDSELLQADFVIYRDRFLEANRIVTGGATLRQALISLLAECGLPITVRGDA